MLRSLVRSRPAWLPARAGSKASLMDASSPSSRKALALPADSVFDASGSRHSPFHSTAKASKIGYKNFKGIPRLHWKVQQELDAKDKEDMSSLPQYVPYRTTIRQTRGETWLRARKKIEHGRLFGGAHGAPPPRLYGEKETAKEGAEILEQRQLRG